jgi:hypothetical protein
MNQDNILIIGSNSLIGSSLESLDLLKGYNIYKTSRNILNSEPSDKLIEFDLARDNNKNIDIEFEWCIYLADLHLIDGLMKTSIKFKNLIAFSTSSVLTKSNSMHDKDIELVKKFQDAENYINQACLNKKISCYVFRPTLIYSIGNDQNITVINNFIKKYKFFPRIGSYSGLRQPVSSDCLAVLVLNVINSKLQFDAPKFYEVAGSDLLTFEEMIKKIFIFNKTKPIFIPVNKYVFKIALKILNYFGFLKNISFDMIDHASMDFNFDISEACNKFNFNPKGFLKD